MISAIGIEKAPMKRNRILNLLFLPLLLGYFTACSPVVITSKRFPQENEGGGHRLAGVPPGHFPPPGHCRIWYPGKPPGHQPPPFKCGLERLNVPLGAWLLSRVDQKNVAVNEYDEKIPNVVKRSYVHPLN